MKTRLRILGIGASGLLPLAYAGAVQAQTMTVSSLTNGPTLGRVASAITGVTTFTVSTSGAITRTSGSGNFISGAGSTAITLVVKCGALVACTNGGSGTIASGTTTGRANALTNFTIAGASLGTTSTTLGVLNFTFPASMGKNGTSSFTIGMDFPIAGNDTTTAGQSTAAAAKYVVTVRPGTTGTTASATGTATATVVRGLGITKTSDLSFGSFFKPPATTGLVQISSTGSTISYPAGVVALTSGALYGGNPPSSAAFLLQGEGAQVYTLTVPASFVMSGPQGSLNVITTSNLASGNQTFASVAGSAASVTLGMGGMFSVATGTYGAYTGTFTVSASYN